MTMSTNTKANAELEFRPLEAHELDTVSGGVTAGMYLEREPTWLCRVLNLAAIRDLDCNTP
jgi:hypothetical protein